MTTADIGIVCTEQQEAITELCTDAILREDFEAVIPYFSEDMKILLPAEALAHAWHLTVEPVGRLSGRDPLYRDGKTPNVIYVPLVYEQMTVKLRFVFHDDLIYGFWAGYEANERSTAL